MKRMVMVFCLIVFGTNGSWGSETYLTVYSSNLGLVRQIRSVDWDGGDKGLRFTDVAAFLIPESVHLRLLDRNEKFQVLEQTFMYDMASPERILAKTIGYPLDLLTGDGEYVQGILLNAYSDALVIQTDDGVNIIPRNDELLLKVNHLPEGLVTRPTISWNVVGLKKGAQNVEMSYLTSGLHWNASYVAILNETFKRMQLESWASIRNESGASFEDAQVKLVAGEIKRAVEQRRLASMAKRTAGMVAAEYDGGTAFEQRAFFEYHLYELSKPVTLKDRESKQFALRPRATVEIERRFVYNPRSDATGVGVRILFKNEKKLGWGEPLPAGIVRVYQEDKGALLFLGEHLLPHKAQNAEVTIPVGNAFDLSGERRVMGSRRISDRSERQTIVIDLYNNKTKEDVTVVVEENLAHRNWKIEDSSHVFTQKDVHQIEFSVPVKENSKTQLQYTVLSTW